MQNADVLVSGAGPVGLFVAHSLARAGVSVKVVDAGMWPCAHSYGLALHPATVDLLSKVTGAELLQRGSLIHTLALYDDGSRRAEINLMGHSGRPMLALPQSALESHLETALNQAGVQVGWRQKVMHVRPDDDRVQVSLDRFEKESCGYAIARTEWTVAKSWTEEARFVIGADGYNSAVRRGAGIRFPEIGPCAWYAVFEFQSQCAIQGEVRVVVGEQATSVLWPLGNGVYRWSFELPGYTDSEVDRLANYREHFGMPSERFKDRLALTTGELDTLSGSQLGAFIAERAPWFKGTVDAIDWCTLVRFERRLASAFGHQRCWLAGDAAHLGGPVGVQSLNLGLAEAHDLGSVISEALRSGNGTKQLEDYNRRYTSEWRRLSGAGAAIEKLGDVEPWVWENRSRLVSCLPAHGTDLMALAEQLDLRV